MKFIIERIHSTFNYGSLMMAVNTMSEINKKIPNSEFYVDSQTEEDLERLKKEIGTDKIYFFKQKYSNNKVINKIIRVIRRNFFYKKEYDAIVVLGGDDISEYYGLESLKGKLKHISQNTRLGLKTVLVGQTIGPFTGERIEQAKKVLNKVKIYTRDDNCIEYLKSIGIVTGIKGRDLAFLDLPNNPKGILEKYNLKKEEYVTVVPSGLYKWYTDDYDKYLSEQLTIIRYLMNNNRLAGKKIVLLSHVIKPDSVDDRKVIKDICNKLNDEEKALIVPVYDVLLSSEARKILAGGILTVTGRMHAAVSTLFSRKPALSLSYSVKYAGVIGEGLKRSDLIIECAGNDKWTGTQVSDAVKEKVEYMLDNYDTLIKEIDVEVSKTSKIVKDELNDVCNYLKK